MHIEFNPGRPTGPGASQSTPPRTQVVSDSETASFEQTRALEQKLSLASESRPEEVSRARSLIADVKYPPEEMMSRIANLLAMHVKNQ
jgi:hypothetical protein